MTPQYLIDLPGYGQANKVVKAMGCWNVTMDDTERIEWIEELGATVKMLDSGEFKVTPKSGELYEVLRPAIDKAASIEMAQAYRAHLED